MSANYSFTFPAAMMRTLLTSLLSLGLLSPAAGAQSACRIVGSGDPEDRARAENACIQAEVKFTKLLNQPAPEGELVLSDTLTSFIFEFPSSGWRLYWPTTAAPGSILNQPLTGSADHHWNSTLPHEVGHAMLAALVEPGVVQPEDRYGTLLPDWLDEAVAIWMEPEGSRAHEIGEVFREYPHAPTVADFMKQIHPLLSDSIVAHAVRTETYYPCPAPEACEGRPRWNQTMRVRSWTRDDGSTAADTAFYSGASAEGIPLVREFYPWSKLLLDFVYERGGSDAVCRLVLRLARGPATAAALAGLPGLPSDAASLESDWQQWYQWRSAR